MVALGLVVLETTKYGRQVVAVGSNPEAARRVGMPARRIIASVYAVTGVASALAGLMIAARLGSGSSNAAVGFELQVIAAVVLGGTSLMGGRGTIVGTILGALTIAVIGNGLILMHISPFFTQIVTGAIILVRDLAQHPDLCCPTDVPAEEIMSELSAAHVRSGQVMTVTGADPGGRPRRHPDARAHPERLLLLVEPAWPRPRLARRRAARARDPLGAAPGPLRQPRQHRADRRS